jgi:YbgC/YbaW family acyl-CoA thioester hydrolase
MEPYRFSIPMTVRINDLNYAYHVGYQNFFSFFQEARCAYLMQFNYSEMDIEGYSMIVGEAHCKYKRELALNDTFHVFCAVTELRSKLFVMKYQIVKAAAVCAEGFTNNLFYDYQTRRVARLAQPFVETVTSYEGDHLGDPSRRRKK